MKKFIICLIFLISFANAIQCYNGKTYVDIPESKLSEIGYTEYNITHSSFDCKVAYKRYLKVKETEPVNVSYVIKNEKVEEEPSKISSLSLICLSVIIVGVIWLIKNIIKDEPQDEWNLPVQQEQVKPKNNVKTEYIKSWDDLSKEYNENLRTLEKERVKNGFYEIPKTEHVNNSLYKTKTAYELLLERPEWNLPVQQEQVKPKNNVKTEYIKSWDDLSKEYSENLRKIEQERVKNGFYEIPKTKPVNNSLDKTKTAYELLLERPEWKAYRLAVLAERGELCEWCGSNKNLQVHHKFYLKYPNGKKILPWEYNINCLLVLCKDCHEKAHKKYKIKSYYTSY